MLCFLVSVLQLLWISHFIHRIIAAGFGGPLQNFFNPLNFIKAAISAYFPKLQIKKPETFANAETYFYPGSLCLGCSSFSYWRFKLQLLLVQCVTLEPVFWWCWKEQRKWLVHPAISGWNHLCGWYLTDGHPSYSKKSSNYASDLGIFWIFFPSLVLLTVKKIEIV